MRHDVHSNHPRELRMVFDLLCIFAVLLTRHNSWPINKIFSMSKSYSLMCFQLCYYDLRNPRFNSSATNTWGGLARWVIRRFGLGPLCWSKCKTGLTMHSLSTCGDSATVSIHIHGFATLQHAAQWPRPGPSACTAAPRTSAL